MRFSEKNIFKNGSTTYYFSSKFFPKAVRHDVYKLYSFVRLADDYVDSIPQNKKEFKILKTLWFEAIDSKSYATKHYKRDSINQRVVKNMVYLTKKYHFDPAWIDAFLGSMQADIDKKTYSSLDGSLWYVYGSAEVIGLMMAKIMGLPKKSLKYAAVQGRAMQWINFIRDIDEDIVLKRSYFPEDDLRKFALSDLSQKTAIENPKAFRDFIHFELARYNTWQREAQKGFDDIPKRLRIPLQTAVANFNWTARKISNQPDIVFTQAVKPSVARILYEGLARTISK